MNPRTEDRHLPRGTLSVAAVAAFVIVVLTMGAVRHFVPSFHDFKAPPAAEMPGPDAESGLQTSDPPSVNSRLNPGYEGAKRRALNTWAEAL